MPAHESGQLAPVGFGDRGPARGPVPQVRIPPLALRANPAPHPVAQRLSTQPRHQLPRQGPQEPEQRPNMARRCSGEGQGLAGFRGRFWRPREEEGPQTALTQVWGSQSSKRVARSSTAESLKGSKPRALFISVGERLSQHQRHRPASCRHCRTCRSEPLDYMRSGTYMRMNSAARSVHSEV